MKWRSNGDLYFNPRALQTEEMLAAAYGEMHARGVVHKSVLGGWFVCGYDLGRKLLVSSSISRDHPAVEDKAETQHHPSLELFEASLFGMSGGNDTAIRNTMRRLFSRGELTKYRRKASEHATLLLDGLPRGREVDMIGDLVAPFAEQVLSELLGLKRDQAVELRALAERCIRLLDAHPAATVDVLAADALVPAATGLMRRSLSDAPVDGTLAASLMRMSDAGAISPVEAVANLGVAFAAGHDTTIALLSNTLNLLANRPSIGAAAVTMTDGYARLVEEAMRFFAPVQLVARSAADDIDVPGAHIERGATVMVILAAANRDPTVFDDPDVFRIDRVNQPRSLGFGHGVHLCAGEHLARLHAEILTEAILRDHPDFTVVHDGKSWRSMASFRFPENVALSLA